MGCWRKVGCQGGIQGEAMVQRWEANGMQDTGVGSRGRQGKGVGYRVKVGNKGGM